MKFFKAVEEEKELRLFYLYFIRTEKRIPENIIRRFKNDLIRLKIKNHETN